MFTLLREVYDACNSFITIELHTKSNGMNMNQLQWQHIHKICCTQSSFLPGFVGKLPTLLNLATTGPDTANKNAFIRN